MPGGSRPRRLFDLLESNFEGFLDGLPPGIRELARQQGSYYGDYSNEPFKGVGVLNPVLVGTPWLFWDTFQELKDEALLRIAEAGAYLVLASVVLDHLVDDQAAQPGKLSLYHQILYSRAVHTYRLIFPDDSPFWEDFYCLEDCHMSGLATEAWVQTLPGEFTIGVLEKIAHGKVSPIVTTLVALSYAVGHPEYITALEASLNHIAVASQLLDDIGDWQADLDSRHLTYFLVQLSGGLEAWTSIVPPSRQALEARLQSEWIDVNQFQQVKQGLKLSIEAVELLNCPAWVKYVNGYLEITEKHLERTIKAHLSRVLSKMA